MKKRFHLRALITVALAFALSAAGALTPNAASASYNCTVEQSGDVTYQEEVTTCEEITYNFVSKQMLQYDYTPVEEQVHLISVAKGQKLTLSESQTVSRTVKVSASVSANDKLFGTIGFSMTGSYTGTTSKTYGTSTVYDGPDASSPYNSRNYYSGTVYDLYNVTVREVRNYTQTVDYYEYGTRTRSNTNTWQEYGGLITEQVQSPRIITYSRDSYYD